MSALPPCRQRSFSSQQFDEIAVRHGQKGDSFSQLAVAPGDDLGAPDDANDNNGLLRSEVPGEFLDALTPVALRTLALIVQRGALLT